MLVNDRRKKSKDDSFLLVGMFTQHVAANPFQIVKFTRESTDSYTWDSSPVIQKVEVVHLENTDEF